MFPKLARLLSLLLLFPALGVYAQAAAPTHSLPLDGSALTLAGGDPGKPGTTTLSVTLVPLHLTFASTHGAALDAAADVHDLLASPLFQAYAFPAGGATQYTDALLRSTVRAPTGHTLLGKPQVHPVAIAIPASHGYLLSSRKDGGRVAVVDMQYLQRELFKQLGQPTSQLVIAVAHNTTFYAEGDDTICCTTGTHGVDRATGASFVLGGYFAHAPAIAKERDLQPLSEQLGEFFLDPLHDPLAPGDRPTGNTVAPWAMPAGSCGGRGIGSAYFLLEPTDTNHKNNFPDAEPSVAGSYHLATLALPAWYTSAPTGPYSFPNAAALPQAAQPCQHRSSEDLTTSAATPTPNPGPGSHQLIGYWTGDHGLKLRDVSPQWDIIIEAFASPDRSAPEGTLHFAPPTGYTPEQLKSEIAEQQSRGKKVMLSLGGGGAFFTLNTPQALDTFVSGLTATLTQYGFNGVDIDFESPSMDLDSNDRDFKQPTTPSIVHLIQGLRALREHFGPGFMISLVPEGPQMLGGAVTYGGQFGSYLPLAWGLRDILSFVDVQDYNTPPIEGLDGEIYQSATADYHAAMTELLLHGFPVGGTPGEFFPALSPDKVAVGFLTDYEPATSMHAGIDYLLTGKPPTDATYRLAHPAGYPALLGGMFWTIDEDRGDGYRYSNDLGPLLHGER